VSETYRVRVLGVKDGFTQESVVAALATLFGRPAAEVQKIFAAKRVVIKNRMDLMEARKFRLTLEQRGCACIVEPDKPAAAVTPAPPTATLDGAAADATTTFPAIAMMESRGTAATDSPAAAIVDSRPTTATTASPALAMVERPVAAAVTSSPSLAIVESAGAAPVTGSPTMAIVESTARVVKAGRPAPSVEEMTTCPRCEYTRKPNETVPDWQCPNCKVAYAKVTYGGETSPGGSESSVSNKPAGIDYALTRAKGIRAENLGHEAAVRSVGVLYYLAAALLLGLAAFMILAPPDQKFLPAGQIRTAGAGIAFVGFLVYLLGNGLRRLRRWACIIAALGAASGLLAIFWDPAKTGVSALLDAYVLWVTMGTKGRYVTSAEYHAVMDETPDMKPGLGLLTWLLIATVVIVGVVIGFGALRGGQYPPGTINPKNLAQVTQLAQEAAQEVDKLSGRPIDGGLFYYYGAEANGAEITMSFRVVRGSPLALGRRAAQTAALREFGINTTCGTPGLNKVIALGGTEKLQLYATEPSVHLIAQASLDGSNLNCPGKK
jgi:ribosomal protein L37AE/L43A